MTETDEQLEAVQHVVHHVVERVGVHWEGTTMETVEDELVHGLCAAGLAVDESDVHSLASAIEASHGTVTVSSVLPR